MPIDLKINITDTPIKVTFKLSPSLMDRFKLYVEAAKETIPKCDDSLILETILENQLKKDKKFKKWLQEKNAKKTSLIDDKLNTEIDLSKKVR